MYRIILNNKLKRWFYRDIDSGNYLNFISNNEANIGFLIY